MSHVSEIYGSMVFNEHTMQERLPSATYKQLMKTIKGGEPLNLEVANVVAHAMKEWAIEKGATHYTHWFQPLTGVTAEKIIEDMKPEAVKRIQSRLVLEAVADKENFEVTDEDVNNEINDMASAYQMEADKLKDLLTDADKENMKRDIQVKKAVEFVTENAKEV